jgi:ABC-2 type transport system permease protein
MFSHIFSFEVNYWLRRPMVYIFIFVNFLILMLAVCADGVSIGGSVGDVHRNAPYVIQNWFSGIAFLSGLMMTAAFMQGAALRDFDNNTYQIVFASPISRASYFFGRFLGAAFVSALPFLGVMFGILLGSLLCPIMGWQEAVKFGPTYWSAYFDGFTIFVIPFVLTAGGIIFSVAALSRSTMAAFIAAIVLLFGYLIAGTFLRDLDNENVAIFTDIFGSRTFQLATKYWTMEQRNTQSLGFFDGMMPINRIFWMLIGLGVVTISYFRFSFTEKTSGKKQAAQKEDKQEHTLVRTQSAPSQILPKATMQTGFYASLQQCWTIAKTEYWAVAKDTTFKILVALGMILITSNMIFSKGSYGLTQYPVTYNIIQMIAGSMTAFMVAIVTFYSGQVVWRERDTKFEQIHDALPYPTWISYVGKVAALMGIVFSLQAVKLICGVGKQASEGFFSFDFLQYFHAFVIDDGFLYLTMIVLSMFIHTLVNNKYVGFFAFLLAITVFNMIWQPLDVQTNMVQLFSYPSDVYSDMAGAGPSQLGKYWFMTYWLLFAGLLASASIALWQRGKDEAWKSRFKLAKMAFAQGGLRVFAISTSVLFALTASWVFYNTKILNTYTTPKANEKLLVAYEQKYKKFENVPLPKIVDVQFAIDIFPKERNLKVKGTFKLVNKTNKPIDSLHFTIINDAMDYDINIPNSTTVLKDSLCNYQIYRLAKALQPHDTMTMTYTAKHETKGFENTTSMTEVVENGSFFNNGDIIPMLGYMPDGEIFDKNDRKKYGLPEKSERMPSLPAKGDSCGVKCMEPSLGFGGNWVNMTTTISTSSDQTAIAPGSLIKEWKEGDRNYYTYKFDKPSVFFGAFCSARYQIKREEWNGVKLEVYYDAKHPYNVDRILKSMHKSLDYYTTNFGPYYHKQCRVIEFPRYQSFAQSFPGTMPYSESVGFIDKYDEEADIDKIFYVVAHEIGHQYWGHQVEAAKVQGSSMLIESFAQYSALMVMEKEYGHDAMRKFLKYEMDDFLRSRGRESLKESVLAKVENQSYIYYQKGSVVMYYLKEMIGMDKVNDALRELVVNYGYKEPPYPTTHAIIDTFEARTPDSLKYIINDLFWKITVFDNRTLDAKAKKLADGTYETTIKVTSDKMLADSSGREKNIPINDIIDVGVFAKPVGDKTYGKMLTSKRVRINKKENTFTFVTKEIPYEAGIDPNCYLIDKVVSDNVKKVSGL